MLYWIGIMREHVDAQRRKQTAIERQCLESIYVFLAKFGTHLFPFPFDK